MYTTLISVIIATLAAQAASSPVVHPVPTPSATLPTTCTINVLKMPSFQTNCTFYDKTSTSTSYTDCGGCELHTAVLGVGLACRTATTVPGLATETVTACKKSGKHTPTATPTPSGY